MHTHTHICIYIYIKFILPFCYCHLSVNDNNMKIIINGRFVCVCLLVCDMEDKEGLCICFKYLVLCQPRVCVFLRQCQSSVIMIGSV